MEKKKKIKTKRLSKFYQQLIGFMFNFNKNQMMIFIFKKNEKYSITNLFVFFSLDLFFLNEEKKIVDIKRNFKPFTIIYKPKEKYRYLIEIPSSLSLLNDVKINDELKI